MIRANVLDASRQDYGRTARAKGAPEHVVIRQHILRSALLPVVTMLGRDIGVALGAALISESGPELGEGTTPVRARSYWEQVWIRFRRDKVAMASGAFIIFLVIVAAIGGPIAAHFLKHGPNDIFFTGVNNDLLPVGPWTH